MGAVPGVPQPFPYQGSKRLLADHVLNCLPTHCHRLIEPFAGSAAISLAVAKSRRADQFLICDANGPLISLWRAIVEVPEELALKYERLWIDQRGRERSYYDEVRTFFNDSHQPEHFLYLLARCVKAAIRYNSQGKFNNSPDNRRLGMRPETMRANLTACSRLFRGRASFLQSDYRDVLEKAGSEDVVYLDPPYQGVCGRRDARYLRQTSFDPFVTTLADLNRRQLPFLLSYDGRRGTQTYGRDLPADLRLTKMEVEVGPSTQSTLLGRNEMTVESMYLSPALLDRLGGTVRSLEDHHASLFGTV